MKQFLVTAFWLASMAIVTPANARPPVEFSFRQGYSSNLFQDPNRLSGAFSEATLSLRGSLDLDGSALSYELSQTERVVKTYIFGNSHETALKLGYQRQLLESVALKLEAAVTRSATGDVFLVLPQQVIGYRETDYGVQGGGEMRAAMLGGTTSVSGKYGRVYKGRAHFNIDLLLPSRLEADVGQMVLAANHVRPLFGGEAGAYAEYAQTFVPQDEQQRFIRYPARSLRGSLAFGRSIGSSFTFLADAGAQALFSDRLGTGKVPVEPYLRVQAEWKSDKGLTLAAGYRQNVGPDRALGGEGVEYRRSDADGHDPPGEHLGEGSRAQPADLAHAPQAGRDEGKVGQRIDRLGPQTGPGSLAIQIDRREKRLPHADCRPESIATLKCSLSPRVNRHSRIAAWRGIKFVRQTALFRSRNRPPESRGTRANPFSWTSLPLSPSRALSPGGDSSKNFTAT